MSRGRIHSTIECEHCWEIVFNPKTETSGGDEDYAWVSIGFEIYEECLKCLMHRPIQESTVIGRKV